VELAAVLELVRGWPTTALLVQVGGETVRTIGELGIDDAEGVAAGRARRDRAARARSR
jgi:hypothetical protein